MRQYLSLPLPPWQLHPNRRASWQAKSLAPKGKLSVKAEYRDTVRWLTVEALQDGLKQPPRSVLPAHLLLTFCFKKRYKQDRDNLSAAFKSGLDGLVDGGLVPSDDSDALSTSVEVEKGAPQNQVLVSWEAE